MNMNHNSGRVCTMHDVEAVQRMVSFYRMLSESNLTVVLKQLTAKEENFMLCCYAEWTRGGESLHWNLKLLVFAVPIQLLKNVNRINPGVRNNDTLKSLERVRHCCTIDLSENIKALTGLDIKGVSISLLRLGLTLSIYSPLHLSKKSYPLIFHYSNIHKRWTSCNDEKETEPHPDFEVHSLVWSSAVSIGK